MNTSEIVQGPYFDVNRRHELLEYRRDSSARICCDFVLQERLDLARKFAEEVVEIEAEMRRILDWGLTRDAAGGRGVNAPRWIGI